LLLQGRCQTFPASTENERFDPLRTFARVYHVAVCEAGFRSVGGFSGASSFAQFGQASFLAGNFLQAKAQEVAGVFVTQYCLPATTVLCPGVPTRLGSYEATRVP